MSDHLPPPMLRSLQGAACVVIIMWVISDRVSPGRTPAARPYVLYPPPNDPQQSGFYLIKVMAREQAGLTGIKKDQSSVRSRWVNQSPLFRVPGRRSRALLSLVNEEK